MRRREVIVGLGTVLATPPAGHAQPPSPRRSVGFLHPGRSQVASMRAASFGHGLLAGVGAREGLEVVSRIAEEENDRLPGMAAELVGLGVQAIAAVSPSAVHAAYRATTTIPIVAVDLELTRSRMAGQRAWGVLAETSPASFSICQSSVRSVCRCSGRPCPSWPNLACCGTRRPAPSRCRRSRKSRARSALRWCAGGQARRRL